MSPPAGEGSLEPDQKDIFRNSINNRRNFRSKSGNLEHLSQPGPVAAPLNRGEVVDVPPVVVPRAHLYHHHHLLHFCHHFNHQRCHRHQHLHHHHHQNHDFHLGRFHLFFYPRVGVQQTANPYLIIMIIVMMIMMMMIIVMMTKVMLIMNTMIMEILMMITINHDIDPARGLNNWLRVDAQESVQIPEHFKTTKNPKPKKVKHNDIFCNW